MAKEDSAPVEAIAPTPQSDGFDDEQVTDPRGPPERQVAALRLAVAPRGAPEAPRASTVEQIDAVFTSTPAGSALADENTPTVLVPQVDASGRPVQPHPPAPPAPRPELRSVAIRLADAAAALKRSADRSHLKMQPLAIHAGAGPRASGGVRPARLVHLQGDRTTGATWQLTQERMTLGRSGNIPFPDDPFMSPCHAELFFRDGRWMVRDLHSRNGVFLRLREPTPLAPGSHVIIGQQHLVVAPKTLTRQQLLPADDGQGTKLAGSPPTPHPLMIVRLFRERGWELYLRDQRVVTLGAGACDIRFQRDPWLSSRHAQIIRAESELLLEDLASQRGTFLSLRGDTVINPGAELLVGDQVFRFETA